MKSALINSIQYQFKKLTNSNISQYQVKKFILPIVDDINYSTGKDTTSYKLMNDFTDLLNSSI